MDAAELKQRRKALGMTQAEFADALGVHRNSIGLMERGRLTIDPRMSLAVGALRTPADAKPKLVDPMERIIEKALIEAGIDFQTDQDGGTESALDFYLPAWGVAIEVKRFYTARTGEQMARAPNVIVAQGERAVRFLAAAIRSGDFFQLARGE